MHVRVYHAYVFLNSTRAHHFIRIREYKGDHPENLIIVWQRERERFLFRCFCCGGCSAHFCLHFSLDELYKYMVEGDGRIITK